jgi:foldase protein PrsA
MSRVPLRAALAVLAAVLCALALATCGEEEGVPSDGVAKVGETVIKKSDFDKWLKANPAQGTGTKAAVPDPPSFTRCVAAKREQPMPKGTPKPNAEQLKRLCKLEYDQRKRIVMEFLIEAEWIKREAAERDVKVSDAEVKRALAAQRQYAFSDPKDYRRFLENSGLGEEELLYRMRVNSLQQKINEKVRKDAKVKEPSDAEVKAYYEKNKRRFAQPETRTLNVVIAKTRAEALKARAALNGGQSFKQVADRYSIDEASKRQGGTVLVAEGQQSRAPEQAFTAKKGQLQGPINTPLGWYVFEVASITPGSKPSFERAKQSARSQLKSQRQQKAVEAYEKEFNAKYRAITTCADDYKVPQCENGPKEEKKAPSGATRSER